MARAMFSSASSFFEESPWPRTSRDKSIARVGSQLPVSKSRRNLLPASASARVIVLRLNISPSRSRARYDVMSLRDDFSPQSYHNAIKAAEGEGLSALIIDSASHEWEGVGGVLDMAAKNQAGGKRGPLVWQQPKIDHQRFFMLPLLQTSIPIVIVNMRAKYPMKEIKKPNGGKEWIRSEELEPKQSDDILFEMFVHGWFSKDDHHFHGTKYTHPTLQQVLPSGQVFTLETGQRLAEWAAGRADQSHPIQENSAAPSQFVIIDANSNHHPFDTIEQWHDNISRNVIPRLDTLEKARDFKERMTPVFNGIAQNEEHAGRVAQIRGALDDLTEADVLQWIYGRGGGAIVDQLWKSPMPQDFRRIGQRPGDFPNLPMPTLDDEGDINFRQGKTSKELSLPIAVVPKLKERIRQENDWRRAEGYLSPNLMIDGKTGQPMTQRQMEWKFIQIRKLAAEMAPYISVTPGSNETLQTASLQLKGLRPTAVVRLYEAFGVQKPEDVIALICAITGHELTSALSVLKHYYRGTKELAKIALLHRVAAEAGEQKLDV